MNSKLLLSLLALTSFACAQAGTITVLSMTAGATNALLIPHYNVSANSYAQGKTIGLDVSLSPSDYPVGPFMNSNAAMISTVNQIRVKWTESYPGEPKPLGVPCRWTVTQSNSAQMSGTYSVIGSPSYCQIAISTTPDPLSYSFSQMLRPLTPGPISHPQGQAFNVVNGEVMFHEENGEWIGVGGIPLANSITFAVNAGQNESPRFTASSSVKITLTGVGNDPVL